MFKHHHVCRCLGRALLILLFIVALIAGDILVAGTGAGTDRARAAGSANVIQYAENESESSTKLTTYQDKAVLTFTPQVAGSYLLIATAELRGSSTSYSVLARLSVDGVAYAELTGEPDQTGIYRESYATHEIVNLTVASHTIKLQYRSESRYASAYIRRARLLAIPLSTFESQENAATQTLSARYATYQDVVSKPFTVGEAGDYLLLSTAEFNSLSTSQSVRVRSLVDATNLGEVLSEAQDTTDWLDYCTMKVTNLAAGSHTLKMQACNSSTTKHKIRNVRVTAIPLAANGLLYQFASAEAYVTNGTATPVNTASLTFAPSVPADYYLLSTAIVGGDARNGTGYNGFFDLEADGTSVGYEQKGCHDNTDRMTFATLKKLSLSATSHTFNTRVRSGASASPDGGMGNARIIALSQIPPEPEPAVSGSLGKTEDSWCGAIPVHATLTALNQAEYPYARAKVMTPASQVFYAPLAWNSTLNRFEGTIYPGSNYAPGCADPTTGLFSVEVQLDNTADFSSIDYMGDAGGFNTFITRRKSSKGTAYDYTDFNPVWNVDHWDYSISDLVVYASAAKSNVAVALPFHPVTSNVGNFTVRFDGAAISPGSAASTNDCWWWEASTHTLYLQKASMGTGEVDVDLTFDSDTDLFATRFDRVNTGDMGNREFYNGLMLANQFWTTFVYGGGHEHAGMQAESRAHEPGAPDVTTDCMERVAVHVDNVARNDGSGSYSYDIKWEQQEWMSYIAAEDNGSLTLVVHSDDTPGTGWSQQLATGIAATRTQTFYAGERYIRQQYDFTNNGVAIREYPMIWGREQWLSSDRDTNDEGRYYGDALDRSIESRLGMNSLATPWMAAYDRGVFAAQGLIFQAADPARYGYFLSAAPLGATSFEWVNYGTEWRPDDNDSGSWASNTFFDKVWSGVAPGQQASFTFWQWFYDTNSWDTIQTAIQGDYAELN